MSYRLHMTWFMFFWFMFVREYTKRIVTLNVNVSCLFSSFARRLLTLRLQV